ncbi:hypothetical protein F3K34_44040 [Streptomyces sp. LBUM 1486]|uniref:hypothetical protein n=1 Tax=Streptomyces scabiei TaxID=1930 RepID=UPI001B32D5D0|nr:hypothetical protein [Streptomyces sp. LBUM 1486]MBP5918759.1 hypothetical protein [Streptomyces sp. LBUM 1486]
MGSLGSYKATMQATDQNGNTGTLEINLCSAIPETAAASAVEQARSDGYTTDGRVDVQDLGNCTH